MPEKKYAKKAANFIIDRKLEDIKIPPNSLEAEQSVLGGLMLDNDRWDNVAERVTTNDFFNRHHRMIFSEMQRLLDMNKPIDLITLSEALEQKGDLESVGGFAYLAELSKNTPSTANISAYAEIVRERAVVREMIAVAHEIADSGYDPQGRSSEDLLDLAESRVFQIAGNRASKKDEGPKSIDRILEDTVARIEQLYHKPYDGVTGISSGYQDIDKKTAGLQRSDLIIIAARPSMGKTTLAMNLCENVALKESKPVLIFSLEMPCEHIMIRMLASLSRVDQTRIRTGQLDDDDWSRISSTMGILLEKRNMYIDDSSGLMPTELRARARRVFREHDGLSLIMIDYLQLMRVPALSDNRTLEIAEISRSLKALAKELQVPVVALSQLNRSLEQRADKRPVNSDLRESGSIEQDADLIMFIYRDEVYNEKSDMKGIAEIIIGKQRNGPIGTVRLTFNGYWSRFDNYAGPQYDCRHEPEVRYTPNGVTVVNITIATSDSWRDKNTGETKEKTEWHRVVIFGKLAEVAGEYLHKGSQVYIEGYLQTRKWQDQNGQDRYTTEVVVNIGGTMQMLGGRSSSNNYNSNNIQGSTKLSTNNISGSNENIITEQRNESSMEFDDDIPF